MDARACLGPQRGLAAAVEVAVLIPVLLLVCIGGLAAWRLWWAGAQLESATAAAARAAAQAPTPDEGRTRALSIMRGDLAASGLTCANADVVSDSSQFAGLSAQLGEPGRVVVTTSCDVSLSDLVFPGLPSSVALRSTATEIVDSYGGRRP